MKTKYVRPAAVAVLSVLCSFCGGYDAEVNSLLALLETDARPLSSRISNQQNTDIDLDQDNIADHYESRLMRKFAPMYYLHPDEWALPSSVDWILPHTRMLHNSGNWCKDDIVLNWGQATSLNLSRQVARDKGSYPGCGRNRDYFYSHTDYPDNLTFYLDIHSSKYGGNLSSARCYAKVGITSKTDAKFEIEYWFFYPFNPSVIAGSHQGDWEHITVYVDGNENVQSVSYAAHGRPTNFIATHPHLNLVDGKRPDVYSARGTHASHPEVGRHSTFTAGVLGIVGSSYEHTAKDPTGVKVLDCAQPGRLINVGSYRHPRAGQEWVKYKGDWGKKKDKNPFKINLSVAGPSGPPLKSVDWNAQARLRGPGRLAFAADSYSNQMRNYTFDGNLANKLGQPIITRVVTSHPAYAQAVFNGYNIQVTFRPRRDVSHGYYTLTVWYSVPMAGAEWNRTIYSRSIPIKATYAGFQSPDCESSRNPPEDSPTACLN